MTLQLTSFSDLARSALVERVRTRLASGLTAVSVDLSRLAFIAMGPENFSGLYFGNLVYWDEIPPLTGSGNCILSGAGGRSDHVQWYMLCVLADGNTFEVIQVRHRPMYSYLFASGRAVAEVECTCVDKVPWWLSLVMDDAPSKWCIKRAGAVFGEFHAPWVDPQSEGNDVRIRRENGPALRFFAAKVHQDVKHWFQDRMNGRIHFSPNKNVIPVETVALLPREELPFAFALGLFIRMVLFPGSLSTA